MDCAGGDLQDRGNTYEFTGLKIGGRTWVPGAEGCGSSGQSSCGVFRGDIDEAMLYGEALAQAQIYSIYHRAYDSNSGGQGITFIRAPTVLKLERLPQGLVGFWPLDGDGDDVSGNNMGGTPSNPDWVAGLYNLAFRFDGMDAMAVPPNPRLDLQTVTMAAWVRPVRYDIRGGADRGIIMNKESSYEMGLEDETGAFQGAFSPCWRWFGVTRVPVHEWTSVAMAYDGTSEIHFIHGVRQETDPCGDGGALTPSPNPLRIGAREGGDTVAHSSQFEGDIDEVMLFSRALSEIDIGNLQAVNYREGGGMANVYAAGDPDVSQLPSGCVGFWPLDGSGADLAVGNNAQADNEEWVKGLFGLAFRFDGDDSLRVSRCNKAQAQSGPLGVTYSQQTYSASTWNLDMTATTMIGWIRPQGYGMACKCSRSLCAFFC